MFSYTEGILNLWRGSSLNVTRAILITISQVCGRRLNPLVCFHCNQPKLGCHVRASKASSHRIRVCFCFCLLFVLVVILAPIVLWVKHLVIGLLLLIVIFKTILLLTSLQASQLWVFWRVCRGLLFQVECPFILWVRDSWPPLWLSQWM